MNTRLREEMTRERALYVKSLRGPQLSDREACTLRELAGACWQAWGEPSWICRGNQLDGMDIVALAMHVLGEEWPGEYKLQELEDDE